MKRRDKEGPGHIPFADVAMATIGPIASLMILFLLIAAITSGEQCDEIYTDAELEELAAELRHWTAEVRSRNQGFEEHLEKHCPGIRPDPSKNLANEGYIPEPLQGYCEATVERVLALVADDVEQLASAVRQMDAAIKQCTNSGPEVIRLPQDKLRFVECDTRFSVPSADPDAPQKVMRPEEVSALFDGITDIVVTKLKESNFTRIDIMGHADERVIEGGCWTADGLIARDNSILSSLRAHTFRTQLLAAIERRGERDLLDQLEDNRLRIYAIGVGESEPLNKNAKSEVEHANNRRIELNFVRE